MSKENLYNQDAIKKLQDMVNKIDIGMLCTHTDDSKHVHAVPMSRQEVDDHGNIWFIYSALSESFKHLQKDSSVCLLYSDPGSYNFLSIHAQTETTQDQERIDKYWNKMMEGWFEQGRKDVNIRILKVIPHEAHYWDTKSNKFITFFKAAVSGISGEDLDVGREGDLNI